MVDQSILTSKNEDEGEEEAVIQKNEENKKLLAICFSYICQNG